jgi:hypothetical protein
MGSMIVALAGRRLDEADTAVPRFPPANVQLVRKRIRALLEKYQPSTVVASAASGVDLIGLQEAAKHDIRRRVILPFTPEVFRAKSVADQGERWGRRFDATLRGIKPAGDLIIHPAPIENEPEEQAYLRSVRAVLDESLALASQELADEGIQDVLPSSRVVAAVVWNGVSSGKNDMSAAFISEASARGITVEQISTR